MLPLEGKNLQALPFKLTYYDFIFPNVVILGAFQKLTGKIGVKACIVN